MRFCSEAHLRQASATYREHKPPMRGCQDTLAYPDLGWLAALTIRCEAAVGFMQGWAAHFSRCPYAVIGLVVTTRQRLWR
jgi:hypothetical protein